MEEYKIANKKEYFECTYNEIINEIAECVKFNEGIEIDKSPDIEYKNELSRVNDFDVNKKVLVRIMEYEDIDSEDEDSNSESEEDEDLENQYGGGRENIYCSYLTYKLKYLKLKFDLL